MLEKNFNKNTPYAEQSDSDNIPFWARMSFHLEYLAEDEDRLEQVLAYMYSTKWFQMLFGEVAFYHQNSDIHKSVGKWNILAGGSS